jgi:hypothetical protein
VETWDGHEYLFVMQHVVSADVPYDHCTSAIMMVFLSLQIDGIRWCELLGVNASAEAGTRPIERLGFFSCANTLYLTRLASLSSTPVPSSTTSHRQVVASQMTALLWGLDKVVHMFLPNR